MPAILSPCLRSILQDGAYLIVSQAPRQAEVLARARGLIFTGVEQLEGPSARAHLDRCGLTRLHDVLPACRIGALRDFVMAELRADLFDLACRIGRDVLGMDGEFFVDDYTILRINFPYPVARRAAHSAENPGIGRTSESVRVAARESRAVDPVYDPRSYHKNEPPAAWAHGPHLDTWTGHSRDGVNLWWALDDVAPENAMLFYPTTFGQPFRPDPRSLYLAAGQPLPAPLKMSLRKGEMLVFNPEMLHGTHLNITDATRLAISTRINPRQPMFSPACFYAREFWHSSRDIEAGRPDIVRRFRRDENLEPPPVETPSQIHSPAAIEVTPAAGPVAVCASERLPAGGKLLVRAGDEEIMILRGAETLAAVQANCPHLGVSLMDGHHDDRAIHCPAHGLSFSPKSGDSGCPLLRLRTYAVAESDGMIQLTLSRAGADVPLHATEAA